MGKVFNALKFVWKNNKVWLIVTASVLALVVTISLVITQVAFLYGTLNIVFGGERSALVSGDRTKYQYFQSDYDSKKETLKKANELNQIIAEEGFVLLKNTNNALPIATPQSAQNVLSKPKISIFGKNSLNLVYGGSGSGGGDENKVVNIYDAMEKSGFEYNPTLRNFYKSNASGSGRAKNPPIGGEALPGLSTGETPQSNYTDSVKDSYSNYNDAAIIVISRIGGEGFDLPRTMLTANGEVLSGSNEGDHYLELDNNEKELLAAVGNSFDKVIVVINSAATMELGFLDDDSYKVDAAIWVASPGGTGIYALGEIINGNVNPSGRTVDTYARDFTQDPSWNNIGNNNIKDGNQYTIGTKGDATGYYFVDYEESIYVGYRYWETRAYMQEYDYEDEEWYYNNVVFPFGYGLSYTNFTWDVSEYSIAPNSILGKDDIIQIKVDVQNTGNTAGKEVVQLYYNAPYKAGQIEKAHVVLGDYAKTKLLQPQETDTVTLQLKVSDMASYDYSDANRNGNKGYELDSGNYRIYIGKNAHLAWKDGISATYGIAQTILYKNDTHNKNAIVENRFDDVSNHITTYLSRNNFEGTKTTVPTDEDRAVNTEFVSNLKYNQTAYDEKYGESYIPQSMPIVGRKAEKGETGSKLYDVRQYDESTKKVFVDFDDERWDNIVNQLTYNELMTLIGAGAFNTAYIKSIDKPKTTDPDGPAGFTNFMGDPTVYDTCFYVSECVIGATWNKDLAFAMGEMVGNESLWGNQKVDGAPYSGWYAPAVNIHRSPFSGRNWEYYSEDPLLSGKMGAEVVKGAMSKGVYTYVKHFAVNDQETNRDSNGLITWLSEQSLREIYLKPFEIIVKEGGTTAMMSSFNRIGTVWAGGSHELLTQVLRYEWGFKGMVISDYNLNNDGYMPAAQMIRAGGDLNLVQDGKPKGSASDPTHIALLQRAAKNILYTVAQSNAMNGRGEGNVWANRQPAWVDVMIWIDVAVGVGLATWGVFAIRGKLKKKKAGK